MKPIAVTDNRLLESLPDAERGKLQNQCQPVELVFGEILSEPDQPYMYVYFPLSGSISLVISITGHRPMGLGLIGNEGMLGATLALGIDDAPLRGLVQGSGTALRVETAKFRRLVMESASLSRTLNRYQNVVSAHIAQSGACSHFHDVQSRLARWLLMTHDRAHADHFHLTHQFLADMLGVQRSAITIAAGALQAKGIIHYVRGEIRVLSRLKLETYSCACYGEDMRSDSRLFG